MTVRTVTSGGLTYGYVPTHPPAPMAHKHRVILQARVVDELTNIGISSGAQISSEVSSLKSKVAADGVLGLTGNPVRCFPDLANAPIDVDVTLSAPGYISRDLSATVGPFNTGLGNPADFPDFFDPVDFGDIAMHRAPVHITGRVMREVGATRTPLGATTIRVAEIWRAEPGPDDDPTTLGEAPDILSLSPGLYRDRPVATNTITDRQIAVGAQSKVLTSPANRGDSVLALSDRLGLSVGGLLALNAGNLSVQEFIEIAAIEGAANADQPARVSLVYPIARSRRVGEPASPAALVPGPGAPANLLRAGLRGDRTSHLDVIQPTVMSDGVVEVAGDGSPEYQTVTRFETTTAPDGTYSLPALSRVARMTVTADRADFAQPMVQTFGPAYGSHGQTIDFVHRP